MPLRLVGPTFFVLFFKKVFTLEEEEEAWVVRGPFAKRARFINDADRSIHEKNKKLGGNPKIETKKIMMKPRITKWLHTWARRYR